VSLESVIPEAGGAGVAGGPATNSTLDGAGTLRKRVLPFGACATMGQSGAGRLPGPGLSRRIMLWWVSSGEAPRSASPS